MGFFTPFRMTENGRGIDMLCISCLMISAFIVAIEVGYGDIEHPIMGIIICLVMMWGAFRLINKSI